MIVFHDCKTQKVISLNCRMIWYSYLALTISLKRKKSIIA